MVYKPTYNWGAPSCIPKEPLFNSKKKLNDCRNAAMLFVFADEFNRKNAKEHI